MLTAPGWNVSRPTDFIAPLNLHLYSSVRCPPAKSNCLRLCHALYAFGPQKTLRGRGKPVFRPSHSHSSRGKRRIYAGAANRTATDSRAGAARNRRHSVTPAWTRSEEPTSELQSLMRISYAVFCLKKKKTLTQSI